MRTLLVLASTLLLAGCASLSEDGGYAPVAATVQTHLKQTPAWARTPAERDVLDARVAELLREPLSADAAVQVALFNNHALQASFFELGISDAEWVQASRLPNPGFGIARLTRGDEREIERSLHIGLGPLLSLPARRAAAASRHARVQREAAQQAIALAADTRQAWVEAVAAGESLNYLRRVLASADAGAELGRRMAAVGNWNALDAAREQLYAADAANDVAAAAVAHVAARERLSRLMGLWGEQTTFHLPERLPDLPPALADRPDIERQAMATRLDVQAARLEADALTRGIDAARAVRWTDGLEFGVLRNSSNEAPVQRGLELGIELPIFDRGEARTARAEALAAQAAARSAQVAIEARSQVRQAYLAWRHAHDVARMHRETIVPLRQRIGEETVLRYNAMLIGVFDLLADARAQARAVNASLAATRDFWLADADLQRALTGPPTLAARGGAPGPAAEATAAH
jgi:outer membrane protein TolC